MTLTKFKQRVASMHAKCVDIAALNKIIAQQWADWTAGKCKLSNGQMTISQQMDLISKVDAHLLDLFNRLERIGDHFDRLDVAIANALATPVEGEATNAPESIVGDCNTLDGGNSNG